MSDRHRARSIAGIDLNAEQKTNPRGFKSHLPFNELPPGARYINSVRNPADVAWSLYKFMEGRFLEPEAVSPDEFAQETFLNSDSYFEHLLSFWSVLRHPEQTIQRVAEFCDISLDKEPLPSGSDSAKVRSGKTGSSKTTDGDWTPKYEI